MTKMHKSTFTFLLTLMGTASLTNAASVGDTAAQAACAGFPAGALKCVS